MAVMPEIVMLTAINGDLRAKNHFEKNSMMFFNSTKVSLTHDSWPKTSRGSKVEFVVD